MKQVILFTMSMLGLLATYYYRAFLGAVVVVMIVFFLANLLLAGLYYLRLRSGEDG